MEVIYLLRKLTRTCKGKKINLDMTFIDLEKAFDCVPLELIWGLFR